MLAVFRHETGIIRLKERVQIVMKNSDAEAPSLIPKCKEIYTFPNKFANHIIPNSDRTRVNLVKIQTCSLEAMKTTVKTNK